MNEFSLGTINVHLTCKLFACKLLKIYKKNIYKMRKFYFVNFFLFTKHFFTKFLMIQLCPNLVGLIEWDKQQGVHFSMK